jgi:tetratricopeptide (TPR) repeat protein/predicted aspartyl protease
MGARALIALSLALLALPGHPARAACKLANVEMPVRMTDLRPLATVKINDTEVQFIVDSGALWSMITPETAADLKLKLSNSPPNFRMEGVGGAFDWKIATVRQFTIAGEPHHNIQFMVGGSDLGAAGLLGQNILAAVGDVEYDFANGVLRLWRPEDCKHTVMAYWRNPDQSFSLMDIQWASLEKPHTIGTAFLNGKSIRVMLDTGDARSVVSLRAAARVGVRRGDPGVQSGGFWHGLGRRMEQTWIAPFDSFKIGNEEIRHTRLRIGDIGALDTDMLLGADFFLSHRVYVASSQHRLYFTYNGGPMFNLEAPRSTSSDPLAANPLPQPGNAGAVPAEASAEQPGSATSEPTAGQMARSRGAAGSAEPTDAEAFGRRGAAYLERRDFGHAIADLTRACELDPGGAQYFYDRSRAHEGNNDPQRAIADLDQAIKLKPDHVPALVARARQRMITQQPAGAVTDLDAADQAASKESDIRLSIGDMYLSAGLFAPAVAQYDLWLAAHSVDARKGQGLHMRCRARALLGRDLDKALSDCSTALRLLPEAARATTLETPALVRLRRGEFDRSLTDYNDSLKLLPKSAWSLYGRGLVKIKKGMGAEGEEDVAAARTLQPQIDRMFREAGIIP